MCEACLIVVVCWEMLLEVGIRRADTCSVMPMLASCCVFRFSGQGGVKEERCRVRPAWPYPARERSWAWAPDGKQTSGPSTFWVGTCLSHAHYHPLQGSVSWKPHARSKATVRLSSVPCMCAFLGASFWRLGRRGSMVQRPTWLGEVGWRCLKVEQNHTERPEAWCGGAFFLQPQVLALVTYPHTQAIYVHTLLWQEIISYPVSILGPRALYSLCWEYSSLLYLSSIYVPFGGLGAALWQTHKKEIDTARAIEKQEPHTLPCYPEGLCKLSPQ
jgi:hypothetical protein